MEVSVIIVNYKTPKLLADCLKSVREKTEGIEYEVIVVDNDSRDESCQMVKRDFPWVKLIESKENLGFGRANNLGYKYSSGKYIFLLNSDTLLINNAVKLLSDFMDRNDWAGIAGGQLYDEQNRPSHSYLLYFPSISWEINHLLCGIPFRLKKKIKNRKIKEKGYIEVSYITGADMMLRRSDIEKYGFFDEDFFLYFEETDLTKRFHDKGKVKSFFYPEAKIVHLEGKSLSASLDKAIIIQKSRRLFYSKHYNSVYTYFSSCIFKLSHIFNMIRYKITNRKSEYDHQLIEMKAFKVINH